MRAGLCRRPEDWERSSAGEHGEGRDDAMALAGSLLSRGPYGRSEFLRLSTDRIEIELMRRPERTVVFNTIIYYAEGLDSNRAPAILDIKDNPLQVRGTPGITR